MELENEFAWEVKGTHNMASLILRLHFPTSLVPTLYEEVADSTPSFFNSVTRKWGTKLVPHTCKLLNH